MSLACYVPKDLIVGLCFSFQTYPRQAVNARCYRFFKVFVIISRLLKSRGNMLISKFFNDWHLQFHFLAA